MRRKWVLTKKINTYTQCKWGEVKIKGYPLSKCFLLDRSIPNVDLHFYSSLSLVYVAFLTDGHRTLKTHTHNLWWAFCSSVRCVDVFICLLACCAQSLSPCVALQLWVIPYYSVLAMHGGAGRHAPITSLQPQKQHANSASAQSTCCLKHPYNMAMHKHTLDLSTVRESAMF